MANRRDTAKVTVEWPEPDDYCALGDDGIPARIPVPRRATIQTDDVTLELELTDGRYAVVSVRADKGVLASSTGDDVFVPRARTIPAELAEALAAEYFPAGIEGPPEHQGYVDAALHYALSYACGVSPTLAVSEAMRVSQSAAAQLVRRARQLGYLPNTTRGRPRA